MSTTTPELPFTLGPWVLEENPTIAEGLQVAAYEYTGKMAGNRCLQIIVRTNNPADRSLITNALPLLLLVKQFADACRDPNALNHKYLMLLSQNADEVIAACMQEIHADSYPTPPPSGATVVPFRDPRYTH
ncbi:hypothetical protein [Larsenimonas suaedae]|uniref:DUF669 domain-containing protein n=1 Tax=Larsenimonas suaedae TaxID=1851019 RepID=A0ABU1GYZ9_9GAMM|nr:hypothetical protein [Larsenimonas suaedae]MCM2973750.1 hypothetical protein [Larsenimonas suaedae]MDR5897274.1 hypothetical protein [Larsenimonas suaedae]